MNRRVEEILTECPGCEVHVVQRYADGSLLILYVPPPTDLAAASEADWTRICENTLMLVPHEAAATLN